MAVKVEYIDGDKNKGIRYDWKKIRRRLRQLGIPKDMYNPLKGDPTKAGYFWALSDRSRGKTTQCLLLGMIMHDMYETIAQYVRESRDMIAPKNLKDMFDTILQYHYIEKITGGRWSSCYYWSQRWYYCNRDDDGNITEKAPSHFMFCTSLDDSDKLKSSYNAPRGDIIIFDEFIQLNGYNYNDFIRFTDIEKTIYRDRVCGVTFMLSNTIDINSPWFDEFCIRQDVELMQQGEARYIQTDEGTHIFIEILAANQSEQRKTFNTRFFGFNNPKLAAITGKGGWASEHYPHIRQITEDPDNGTETEPPKILYNKIYLKHAGKLLRLMVVQNQKIGICVYVHPATRTYRDSVILTNQDISDTREIYGFGSRDDQRLQIIWRLYAANRFYYATNADGALLRAYVKSVKDNNRRRMV